MTNEEKYRQLCEKEKLIPLFMQAWWLDATCRNQWDVVLIEKSNQIQLAMPYVKTNQKCFSYIGQGELSPYLGLWLRAVKSKYAQKLAREKDLMDQAIKQLPDFDDFAQTWHYSNTNWLPFYWAGYTQRMGYTYQLRDLTDLDKVYAGFQSNIRSDIRKATKLGVTLLENPDIEAFLGLNEKTFSRQGKKPPYSKDFVRNMHKAAQARGQSKIFIAKDAQGQKHAGIYLIWDEDSAYYLMGGGDPKLRTSGATSLCMWEAIKFSSTVTKQFDFEGSMIEPIERFFRAFGAVQTPYFRIEKTNSKIMRLVRFIKSL